MLHEIIETIRFNKLSSFVQLVDFLADRERHDLLAELAKNRLFVLTYLNGLKPEYKGGAVTIIDDVYEGGAVTIIDDVID